MPANATLEFASARSGRERPVAAVRLPYAAAGARAVASVSQWCGEAATVTHAQGRARAHCATRQRSWRAVLLSTHSVSEAHPAPRRGVPLERAASVPRGVCLDARRGERALRDSADLLEALHMPFDVN